MTTKHNSEAIETPHELCPDFSCLILILYDYLILVQSHEFIYTCMSIIVLTRVMHMNCIMSAPHALFGHVLRS